MFKISRYTKYIGLCLLAVIALASCSDRESGEGNTDIPEGMTRLTLMIPDYEGNAAQFGSRAYDPKEEGYMSNLYFIAVKYADLDDNGKVTTEYDSGTAPVYAFSLNPVGEKFKVGENDYHTFNITLYPGKYKCGVLANVDLYLWRTKKITDFTKESDLNDIVLYFSEDTPLLPYHLPMACLPPDIKYSEETDGNKGAITKVGEDCLITLSKNNTTTIFADMDFLCSKVRYTIMFDKTEGGISEAYGDAWIRFNVDDNLKPRAINLRSWTRLFKDSDAGILVSGNYINKASSSNYDSGNDENKPDVSTGASGSQERAWWNMSIDRYYWPGVDESGKIHTNNEGADYPKKWDSELDLWDGTTDEWISSEQKVWQGIVYLPENLLKSKTRLEFPYHIRQNSLAETPEVQAEDFKIINLFGNDGEEKYEGADGDHIYEDTPGSYDGLERDYFYDVVVKIVNPSDMTIKVFVSILPWHEIDQNLEEEWLQNTGGEKKAEMSVNGTVNSWEYEGSSNVW